MIPDYCSFIRFQDKRLIPFFYGILLIILGFYWKNNDFAFTQRDAWFISGILAIALFNFIYELKAYWAYSCVIGRIDVDRFDGKTCSNTALFLSRPVVVSGLSVFVFWLIAKGCLLLPTRFYSAICLFAVSPLFIYLVFRSLRPIYIRQIMTTMSDGAKYKHLGQYVTPYILLSTVLNVLSVSPLKANPDFSFSAGFVSAKLIIAMLILCAIVLAINLAFSRFSKRYIFLGRFFLKEIDFFVPEAMPFASLYVQPFVVRMLFLLIVQAVWILCIGVVVALLSWNIIFEVYFLLCVLPCVGYYWLHVYWHWHNEFLLSFDMYCRYEEYKKRNA